jgi:hydroxymethylpyrimidine pyrophosphatase-like HAD family hydrolase
VLVRIAPFGRATEVMSDLTKTALLTTSLRLLCTDYDGTLAEPDGKEILPLFFERLAAWRKRGPLYWVINTGRTFESLQEDLERRRVPIWPDWVVAMEREIWLIRGRRGVGWFEWNRKCELMHQQLWGSVKPLWRLIEDYIVRHTRAQLAQDAGSPLGIIATCEEEADEISAFIEPLLKDWPMLTAVRNSIYFRFSHRSYHKGACLEAIAHGMGVLPLQIMAVGDHLNDLPMLERRYAHHLACPVNAVDLVKKKVASQGGHLCTRPIAQGVVEAWDRFFPQKGINRTHGD